MTPASEITYTEYGRALRYSAAIVTLGVAAIHLAVAPDHLQEYVPFGVLFLAVGLTQAILALRIFLRPSRQVFAGVIRKRE